MIVILIPVDQFLCLRGKIMKQRLCLVGVALISSIGLFAAQTLKVKNNTTESIEFKLHTNTAQVKTIAAGKSVSFSLDMSMLSGLDWQIPSKWNPKCNDWYVLDKATSAVRSLNKQKKDATLVIADDGGFELTAGTSRQKTESMKEYAPVCHN
jgi:hypothetical protein